MNQTNIFEMLAPKFKINKKIRLIELFAGIGSQAMALRDLGVEFERYKVVEFDKYAIKSYNAIHGTNFETSDIRDIHASDLEIVDTDKYIYIVTYSFPCQDLSKAGKRKGMEKGSGTRSGLLWEFERILDEIKDGKYPTVLLMENVPDVIGMKNIKNFQKWRLKLEQLGYSNFVECLNAKNYGIPQNRNRCFMVSIHGNFYYEFPKPIPLELRLKNMLEDEVDEKYYLSEKIIDGLKKHSKKQVAKGNSFAWKPINENDIASTSTAHQGFGATDNSLIVNVIGNRNPSGRGMNGNVYDGNIIPTLTTNKGEGPKIKVVANLSGGKWDTTNESCGRVYSKDGLCPTITSMQGGNQEPKIADEKINRIGGAYAYQNVQKKGYAIAHIGDGIYINRPHQKRGVVQKGMIQTLKTSCDVGVIVANGVYTNDSQEFHQDPLENMSRTIKANNHDAGVIIGSTQKNASINHNGIVPTLTTAMGLGGGQVPIHNYDVRIRKLTPLECWRLMGFTDYDYYKASKVNSNSQLYKQAGNSIVKQVLMAIFKQML